MDLKELGAVDPDSHWYCQAKLQAVASLVERLAPSYRNVLDVGAGDGYFASKLTSQRPDGAFVCVDPNYSMERTESGGKFVLSAVDADVASADVILMMDVLEHVADDGALLREYVTRARPGSIVLITVPAFEALWSSHDVYMDHFRRYRLTTLVDLATVAGLEVVHSRYLFASIFPVALLGRQARRRAHPTSDLRPVTPFLNRIIRWILSVEHRIMWNRFFGLSALVAARVPTPRSVEPGEDS